MFFSCRPLSSCGYFKELDVPFVVKTIELTVKLAKDRKISVKIQSFYLFFITVRLVLSKKSLNGY